MYLPFSLSLILNHQTPFNFQLFIIPVFSWYARGFYQQSRKGTDSNIVDVSDTIISLLSIQNNLYCWKWPVILQHVPENDVYKDCCKMLLSFILFDYIMLWK